MPRKREVTISESLEDLQRLEEEYRGKPEAVRITVLKLLKQDEKLGIEDVGVLVGFSKPTVKRWWRAYREGGLDAVLLLGAKRAGDVDEGLNLLKQKLIAGEFRGLNGVQEWIAQHRRVSSAGRHERAAMTIPAKNGLAGGIGNANDSEMERFPLTSARLLKFLSDLSLSHELTEWQSAFRKALQELLGDVDRISLSLNLQCDLLHPDEYRPDIVISQSMLGDAKAVNPMMGEDAGHFTRLNDNLRRQKFPFDHYHQPHSFVYYYGKHAYLGVMALWRDRSKPVISQRTLEAMENLRGLIVFVLSDFVARYNLARPVEHAFDIAMEGLVTQTGLTMQERRIMILQLLGLSYEEVADTLNISLNTVRYHLRSIYNKTGAHSQAELFAKYFTPRVDP